MQVVDWQANVLMFSDAVDRTESAMRGAGSASDRPESARCTHRSVIRAAGSPIREVGSGDALGRSAMHEAGSARPLAGSGLRVGESAIRSHESADAHGRERERSGRECDQF